MQPKDITNEWVQENFDINAERRFASKEQWLKDYDLNAMIGYKRELTIEEIRSAVDDALAEVVNFSRIVEGVFKKDENPEIKLDRVYVKNGYDELEFFGVYVYPETDRQVIMRLKKREREKLQRAIKKSKKEERDRKEYERLKAKFE